MECCQGRCWATKPELPFWVKKTGLVTQNVAGICLANISRALHWFESILSCLWHTFVTYFCYLLLIPLQKKGGSQTWVTAPGQWALLHHSRKFWAGARSAPTNIFEQQKERSSTPSLAYPLHSFLWPLLRLKSKFVHNIYFKNELSLKNESNQGWER